MAVNNSSSEPAVRNEAETGPAATNASAADAATMQPRVVWDDSKMTTSFANVVNVLSTREEMALLFGTNQTWNALELGALTVQLSNRIVLTPYAAKRLSVLLQNRIKDYESRFGTLNM
ncbi:MAG TPA: DUF3467 domain-containing protein [Stellaceae bacterium]|nr:DUF3467 domain-containing protein [Stellaceae bacterium]